MKLKPVDIESGWLIAPADLGKAGIEPVAFKDWKGDPRDALWYPDQAFAETMQKHLIEQFAKKPQQLNFLKDDGSVPQSGGTFSFRPKFIDDQGTFKLEARFIDAVDNVELYSPGTKLQHGDDPILYRVNSGAVRQVGPDSFRIVPTLGPIGPQGNPWEPTLIAYSRGDNSFRPTERPAHAQVSIVNTEGSEQTIDFPAIADHSCDDPSLIRLSATASSGLPVQYFVISGPVRLSDEGGILADGSASHPYQDAGTRIDRRVSVGTCERRKDPIRGPSNTAILAIEDRRACANERGRSTRGRGLAIGFLSIRGHHQRVVLPRRAARR